MNDFFFAKLNEDGTCGEPIPVSGVKEITITSLDESMPEVTMPSFTGEISFEIPMDYKTFKNFVWVAILNLKRSTKHLVSKNIWNR